MLETLRGPFGEFGHTRIDASKSTALRDTNDWVDVEVDSLPDAQVFLGRRSIDATRRQIWTELKYDSFYFHPLCFRKAAKSTPQIDGLADPQDRRGSEVAHPQISQAARTSPADVTSWVPVLAASRSVQYPRRLAFEPVTAGSQIIRLATSPAELDAAQALRYRVFYEEMGAHPLCPEMAATRRDFDRYDAACDHLIVVDQQPLPRQRQWSAPTASMWRREHARAAGGFYSASEYDVSRLANFPGTVMELGRSCVDAAYRDRATMQLLWRGIAEYVNAYGVDLMFGCASLPGTDPWRSSRCSCPIFITTIWRRRALRIQSPA